MAMQRAAEAARRLAEQTGMELVVEKLMREALSGAGTAIDICEVIDTNLSTSSVTQEYGGIFYGLLPHRLQGVDDQGRA